MSVTNIQHAQLGTMLLFLCKYRCEYGVLDHCFGESDLELFSGKLNLSVEGWEQSARVSLRVAAMQLNPRNAFHGGICNCKSRCKTKKCSCRQKGVSCTSKCHQGRMCENCSQDEKENEKDDGVKNGCKKGEEDDDCFLVPKRQRISLTEQEAISVEHIISGE